MKRLLVISFLFLLTFIPIILKNLIAISNLGLSFLFNSPNSLNVDIPFVFVPATRKININSSITELFKLGGQLIDFNIFELLTNISAVSSPL